MTLLIVLGWLFTALLAVLLVASIFAASGRLPRNRFFGLKFPALETSDPAWRAGHRAAIVPSVIAVVVAAVFALLGALVATPYFWGSIVAFVGGVVWIVVVATRAAKRVASS
jgi:hypothetical protein